MNIKDMLNNMLNNSPPAMAIAAQKRSPALPGDMDGPSAMLALGLRDLELLVDATNALALSGEEPDARLARMQQRLRVFRDHLAPVNEVVCFHVYWDGGEWVLQRLHDPAPGRDLLRDLPWSIHQAGKETFDTSQRAYYMRGAAKVKVALYLPRGAPHGYEPSWWRWEKNIDEAMAKEGCTRLLPP